MATRSSKLTGSAASVIDYLKDEDRVLGYYDGTDGFDEVWGGLGRQLGLERGITNEQWSELFVGHWDGAKVVSSGYRQVRDPKTNDVISKETGVRTPMIDIVFAVPKGISELYARAANDAQAKAIGDAVLAAAKVAWTEGVEAHARVARVPAGQNPITGKHTTERVTADLLCTPALQFTARPTQDTIDRGSPADPHLHVHCATFTACKVDGRWLTADEAGIKRSAVYRDAIFLGEVSRNIENLGYRLNYTDLEKSRSGRISFEPAASDPALRRFWSTNHERTYAVIRQFEEDWKRVPTDAELNQIMSVTRGRKADKEMDARPVRSRWLHSARAHGHPAELVMPTPWQRSDYDERATELWDRLMGPKGLCVKDATFGGDTIAIAIARDAIGLGFSRDKLRQYERELREALVVVRPAATDRHQLYTTQVQLDKERFILKRRLEKARQSLPKVPELAIAEALDRQPIRLDDEQRTGVLAACGTTGWVHIEGYAGSGKTTLLAAVKDAHTIAGTADQFVVVSTAAATAERTGRKLGAHTWGSVESIVRQIESGALRATDSTVWMVDEAAMMDAHRMSVLLGVVGQGRVILVGDRKQLAPIGPAGWYGESIAEHGSTLLTNVHRHRDPADTQAFGLLRRGEAARAIQSLVDRSRLHVDVDSGERLDRVMRDYANMRDHGYGADQIRQVIETSNQDVDRMNRFVQWDRLGRSEIKTSFFEVEDAEQGRRWHLHEGDQVIFLRSYKARGQDPVKNGVTGTVLSLDPKRGRMKVGLEDRIVVMRLQASEWSQPVGLAYAQHANKLQGGEVEMVQVLPGTDRTATANSGYSQLTRAQHEAHVYLSNDIHGEDPYATLARAWSVSPEPRSALWHQKQSAEQPAVSTGERPPSLARFTDAELRHKACERADWIAFRYGEDLTTEIVTSPAWPHLVMQLDDLDGQGIDSRALLADAIEERELTTAGDAAAVISWRLDERSHVVQEVETPWWLQGRDFTQRYDARDRDLGLER